MTDTQYSITGEEVEALAKKLDTFGEQLSEKERATLLSVMSLAGSAIEERVGDSEVETFGAGFALGTFAPQAQFGNGLRSAFAPVAGAPSSLGGAGGPNPLAFDVNVMW